MNLWALSCTDISLKGWSKLTKHLALIQHEIKAQPTPANFDTFVVKSRLCESRAWMNLLDKRFLQLKFQRLLEEMQRMPWGSILAIFMKSNIQQNIWRNRFFFTFVLKNCNTCIFKLFCCNFFWLISVHILCIVTNKCKCSETNDIEIKLKLFVKVI